MWSSSHTVREVLAWATDVLCQARVSSAGLDAEVLLAHVLGWERVKLHAWPEFDLMDSQRRAFRISVGRRRSREPVAYIIGHREFYGLDFVVDRRVLIPRPETELLVECALEAGARLLAEGQELLLADIGTGSGAVAVSLAVNLAGATIYATEASAEAMEVAALNVARHGVSGRVQLLGGDLVDPLAERVHIMAANLPYIRTEQLSSLIPEVAAYEPRVALDGGTDGLVHIRRLLEQAGSWLLPRGVLLAEIGAEHGQEVLVLAEQCYPAAELELFQDYAGLDRVVRITM
jgi:release factor glutamine methyltransferase